MSWPSFWQERTLISWVLRPLSLVYTALVRQKSQHTDKLSPLSTPVVIVGNLVVGGSGKTPMLLWLIAALQDRGYKVGVISRGYGVNVGNAPQWVTHADAQRFGDEPALIAWHFPLVPLVVFPKRLEAIALLQSRVHVDVILSDDGLQHWALPRDYEVVMFDGQRKWGNGWCLPAGPLREPLERLGSVQQVLYTQIGSSQGFDDVLLVPQVWHNLKTAEEKPLQAFAGQKAQLLAGIGNPARFAQTCASLGVEGNLHAYADHYAYQPQDFYWDTAQQPLLMTAKDGIKCQKFARHHWWVLMIKAQPHPQKAQAILNDISALVQLSKTGNPFP